LAEEKGLARASAVYHNRRRRAEELKAAGKKIIGYLCAYPPLEMMTALDIVPFRLLGDINEPISKADSCLPSVVCPFIRSTLDLGLKQRYEFLDGVVMAHSCDVAEKTAHIWNTPPAHRRWRSTGVCWPFSARHWKSWRAKNLRNRALKRQLNYTTGSAVWCGNFTPLESPTRR